MKLDALVYYRMRKIAAYIKLITNEPDANDMVPFRYTNEEIWLFRILRQKYKTLLRSGKIAINDESAPPPLNEIVEKCMRLAPDLMDSSFLNTEDDLRDFILHFHIPFLIAQIVHQHTDRDMLRPLKKSLREAVQWMRTEDGFIDVLEKTNALIFLKKGYRSELHNGAYGDIYFLLGQLRETNAFPGDREINRRQKTSEKKIDKGRRDFLSSILRDFEISKKGIRHPDSLHHYIVKHFNDYSSQLERFAISRPSSLEQALSKYKNQTLSKRRLINNFGPDDCISEKCLRKLRRVLPGAPSDF